MKNKMRPNESQFEYLLDIKEERTLSSTSLNTSFKLLPGNHSVIERHFYSDICD